MGLLERLFRVIRANINNLVNEAESPEQILEQVLIDMEQNLITLRQSVAQAIATQKRNERHIIENKMSAEQWYKNAQFALAKGDKILAKESLIKRDSYQKIAENLQEQIKQQVEIITQLKQDILVVETRINEAKTKKDFYLARAHSAITTQKVKELNDNLDTGTSQQAFERLEDKIIQLEAQAKIMEECRKDELEKRFMALENFNQLNKNQEIEESD